MASNKRNLKAYVRFDGSGRVIAGSLILQAFKPKVGNWQEINAYECCNYVPPVPVSCDTYFINTYYSPTHNVGETYAQTMDKDCNTYTYAMNYRSAAQDPTNYYSATVRKFNPDGSIAWVFSERLDNTLGYYYDTNNNMVTGSDNSVYVSNQATMFKVNPDGTLGWVRSTTNSSYSLFGFAISQNDDLYTVGNNNYGAIKVAKIDVATGNVILQKEIDINSSGSDYTYSDTTPVVDSQGNLIFETYADFPGVSRSILIKLDTNLNLVWAKSLVVPTSYSFLSTLSVDSSDNIYCNLRAQDLNPAGGYATIKAKLDSSGNVIWQFQEGSATYNTLNNAWATTPLGESFSLYPGAFFDATPQFYITKHGADGSYQWSTLFNTNNPAYTGTYANWFETFVNTAPTIINDSLLIGGQVKWPASPVLDKYQGMLVKHPFTQVLGVYGDFTLSNLTDISYIPSTFLSTSTFVCTPVPTSYFDYLQTPVSTPTTPNLVFTTTNL